jgi:hypothetical protein
MEDATQSLFTTVSEGNTKMFAVGLTVVNALHARFPQLQQEDMRVVWFGAALQGQVPVLACLCQDVEFEIHTRKACPVSAELLTTLKVAYHDKSFDECLSHIETYVGPKKLAVLLDLDFHIRPHELSAMNQASVGPTVASESVHYDRYTAQYSAACERLSRCGHVVLVSTPFRLPWMTRDFASKAHAASWLDAALPPQQMRCPDMLVFQQFGSRAKSTELRGLMVTGSGYSERTVDWQELDATLHGTATETRELARAKFMLEQLQTFEAVTDARRKPCPPGTVCLKAWSDAFVRNSIGEVGRLVHDLESANSAKVIYKDAVASTWAKAV